MGGQGAARPLLGPVLDLESRRPCRRAKHKLKGLGLDTVDSCTPSCACKPAVQEEGSLHGVERSKAAASLLPREQLEQGKSLVVCGSLHRLLTLATDSCKGSPQQDA